VRRLCLRTWQLYSRISCHQTKLSITKRTDLVGFPLENKPEDDGKEEKDFPEWAHYYIDGIWGVFLLIQTVDGVPLRIWCFGM
jgi:hypothetical protein